MSLPEGYDKFVFVAFLVSTMVGLGIQTKVDELRSLLADRGALGRALLVNFAVAPLLGIVIVRVFPLPPGAAEALLILACSPGGPAAVHFTSKVKGEEALAGALVVVLSGLAVLLSPLIVQWVLPGDWEVKVPYLRLVAEYSAFLLAPLAAGMLLATWSPRFAQKLARVFGILTLLLFATFTLGTRSFRKEAIATVGFAAVGAMLLFVLVMMAAAWFLGGPQHGRRRILASASSLRNAAIAMAIARESSGAGALLMPPVVAFSMIMLTPNTLFTLWHKLMSRLARAKAA